MEPIKPAAGQKSTKQPREKSMLQRKWGSEPSAGTKRSTFADQELKRHSHRDTIVQSSSGSSTGSYSPGKLQMSTAVGQPPQENQYPQHFPSPYSYQMAHPFSQQSIPQRFLHNTKPQRGPDISAWPFASKLQSTASEDLLSVHSRGHGGVFSRRKSPSLAAAYSQYSQAGMEPAEEMHKKEQKPKKPGKYICHYCGRACAKPSVLKKHIRSHTGERPYPCIPCGFSFKTKSNLYKHRKSHAHAIKAGLVPFSDLATSRSDMDQPSSVGEAEVHSDGEQSTDTDEEIALGSEGSVFLDKSSPVPQISLLSDKKPLEKGSDLTGMDPPGDLAITPMKVPILIVPKSGIQPVNECPPFTETETSKSAALAYRVDDSHTIKQRLALRLNEKKGSDSEPMLNLLSPHSKGSTDSGYFSRSESADQQISPPNTNAKSYEEIIFGKYYRLNPRSAVTGMVSQDSSAVDIKEKPGVLPMIASKFGITKIIDEHISQLMTGPEALGDHRKLNTTKMTIFSDSSDSSHLLTSHDSKQYPAGSCQTNTGLLEALPDSGPLIRSNSMPTQSAPSLSVPQGLRGSHSFDERMTSDDVFYPGTTGVSHRTMLRRQAAFELSSAHEGHVDSDSYSSHSKSIARGKLCELGQVMPEGKMLNVDRSLYECEMCETSCRRWEDFENHKRFSCPELRGSFCAFNLNPSVESYSDYVLQTQLLQQRQATETATRKRRKEKSVGDDEDPPSQYGTEVRAPAEMLVSGDYDPKLKGENFEAATSNMTADDVLLVTDSEKMTENRRAAGNVISVIQHTNSLSRPNSFEKSESIELLSYQDKLVSQHSEQSDSETTEDVQTETTSWAESMERQKTEGRQSALPPNHQQYHMPHRLVRQPNIQVPEIRVTEEPDKPEKELEVPAKEPEKPVEEFQWPQRSETLSQLPAEKLPPKKKRLRLAEIEHSSGESSFESTCTSLSRSPSQESNLSHSSSFSMSFDRDENMKSVSPTKQDELGKPSEFLTVPGSAHSLSIPSQHQQREMRRSSSEQAPCPLPIEIPEIRSKSFDYGSLSPASTQADPYVNSVKERKRCFLVRQASLSVYPETGAQEQSPEQAAKQDHVEQLQVGHYPPYNVWHGSSSSGLQSIPFGDSSKCKRSLQYHGVAEEPQQEGHSSVPKVSYNPGQITPENDGQPHEHSGREVMQYSSFHASSSQSPFPVLPIQQALFWQSHHGSSPRHLQQHLAFQAQHLQKLHIRPPNLSLVHQKGHSSHQLQQIHEQPDAKALESLCDHSFQYVSRASSQNTGHISSQTYTTSGVLLQQVQPVFATQNIGGSQPSLPGMLVPVRIQTHVPSYSSVMYTSVSQIIVSHSQSTSSATVLCKVSDNISQGTFSTSSAMQGIGFNLSHILGHHGGLLRYPLWKVPQPLTSRLEAGIPLCLTSGSITVTDASSSIGGSKRMLSPASSLELFMETKQQKRVKEEKMYGQIVEELSAVELSNSGVTKDHSKYQKPEAGRREGSGALKEGMVSSSSLDFAENKALSPKPVSHPDDSSDNVSLLQKTLVKSSSGRDSPEELEVDEATPETGASPRSFLSASSTQEDLQMQQTSKVPVNMLVHLAANQGGAAVGGTILLTDVADVQQLFQFPSLRTTTSVSWCFLNYTKPNHSQTTPVSSVYASWCISSYNPNPPSLSTKASLALLRSRQRKNTETYTMAAFYRPGSGKLVSSLSWKQKFDQVKPELTQLEVTKFEKKAKPTAAREREKGEHLGEKDISGKPAEPTRIKIFEGGYKSNEDYVYVRGRGRGKYICEECGIRCKKPSMLKKHIRTHTDVRPYVCKFCNFAFKTKGNLTKHMKSKAHMKKCLELGVSVTSVDDVDADEADDTQRESEKVEVSEVITEHQFSDAEDSDGAEEEGDENDDDEEDDEDYEGDSTPKTRSRSTSPQPCRFPSLPVTAASPTQNTSEILGSSSKPSVISYLVTLPSIQITQLMAPSDTREDSQMTEYQRLFQRTFSEPFKHRLDVPTSMDEDYLFSPENSSSSRDLSPSRLSSPGCDSSPYREPSPTLRRYLSPRRDVSPRGHLSPRREASPLRHLSPKRDISFKREVSPRRDFSPRRHLSPVSLAKVVSSGKDISSRREMSPRSRHRGMIRAASPRRGFHHQSSSWPAGPNLSSELVPLGQRLRTQFELDLEQRKDSVPPLCYSPEYLNGHEPAHSSLPTGSHQGYLFSHLPLHSQQQIRAPFPMIPIGGIQMVHSVPASVTGLAHSSRLPLQKSTSEESSTSEVSYPMMDCSMKASDYPASHQEKAASSQITTSRISPSSLSFSQKEKSLKTKEEMAEIMEKEKQEEILQTCTKAIASLRIAAEDGALSGRDEPAKASDPPQKPLESAPLGIQHFSGPEASHEAACASATQSDSHVDKDNLSVAKTALGHSTFYSRSAEDRLSGQLGSRELPTSTRDPAREVLEKGELH